MKHKKTLLGICAAIALASVIALQHAATPAFGSMSLAEQKACIGGCYSDCKPNGANCPCSPGYKSCTQNSQCPSTSGVCTDCALGENCMAGGVSPDCENDANDTCSGGAMFTGKCNTGTELCYLTDGDPCTGFVTQCSH